MYFSECKDFQAQNMSQIQHSSDALFHIAVTNNKAHLISCISQHF